MAELMRSLDACFPFPRIDSHRRRRLELCMLTAGGEGTLLFLPGRDESNYFCLPGRPSIPTPPGFIPLPYEDPPRTLTGIVSSNS